MLNSERNRQRSPPPTTLLMPSVTSFPETEYKQSFALDPSNFVKKTYPIKNKDSVMFGTTTRRRLEPISRTTGVEPEINKIRLLNYSTPNSLNFYFDNSYPVSTNLDPNTPRDESNTMKANFAKRFDESNNGFGDVYARTRGDILLRLKKNDDPSDLADQSTSSFVKTSDSGDKITPFHSISMPVFHTKPAKKSTGRNMFASHIDSHLFPGKYDTSYHSQNNSVRQSLNTSLNFENGPFQSYDFTPTMTSRKQISYSMNDQNQLVPNMRPIAPDLPNLTRAAEQINRRNFTKSNIMMAQSSLPPITRRSTYQNDFVQIQRPPIE